MAACSTIEPVASKISQPVVLGPADPVGPVGPPSPDIQSPAPPKANAGLERDTVRRAHVERSQPQARTSRLPYTGGAYFENDGPGENIPANIDSIPDAKPRKEALAPWANRPYTLFGRQYVPEREIKPFKQQGVASWYGRKFHGNKTANGERYDMYAMTAAHPTLPLPSYARVTNARTGQSVVVRVNDRGPFLNNRVIDLSFTAAHKLGYLERGFAEVVVEQISFDESSETRLIGKNSADSGRETVGIGERTAVEDRTSGSSAPVSNDLGSPTQSRFIRTAIKGHSESALPDPSADLVPSPATGAATLTSDNLQSNPRRQASREPGLASGITHQSTVYVQMGAFQNQTNAIWALAWAEEHFDDLSGKLEIFENDGWFKVQVGPFSKRSEAVALQEQIRLVTDFTPFLAVRANPP